MEVIKILGSAGTGKTTKLIDILKQKIQEGYKLEEIGFFSFSRVAINEVKVRANIPDKSPFFCTLHSLAYNFVGADSKNMYKQKYKKEYYNLNKRFNTIDQYIENKKCSYKEAARTISKKNYLSEYSYNKLKKNKQIYKEKNNLCEFSDLINKFINLDDSLLPNFKIIFIDEAQDLSFLLWAMVEKLKKKVSDTIYLAGDDDQAIYGFGGATADKFIEFKENKRIILDTNYRNPSNHYDIATKIVKKLKVRIDKKVNCIKKSQSIKIVNTIMDVSIKNEKNKTIGIIFRHYKDVRECTAFLKTLSVSFIDYNNNKIIKNGVEPNIYISTIHKMKGREFDKVILYYNIKPIEFNDAERRILFVGLTRSKKQLIIVAEENSFLYL